MRTVHFVALLALVAAPSHAAEYCVSTLSQLQDALNDAEVDGVNSEIRLRAGVFPVTSNLTYDPQGEALVPAGRLVIRGGYGPGCTTRSDVDGATRLTGGGGVSLVTFTQTGDVTIAGIAFEGVHVAMISRAAGFCLGNSPTFATRRLRVSNASIYSNSQCHDTRIDNTLVVDGQRGPFISDLLPLDTAIAINHLDYEDERIGSMAIINSTVVNGRVNLRSFLDLDAIARIYNSVFVHSATEIRAESTDVLAVNNRYDSLVFTSSGALSPASANNTSAAALLDANFQPAAGSPLLNSGTAIVPGGLPDIDQLGGDRVVGVQVDRGARESLIDGSGNYTVTNTATSGIGSLSWAVTQSNNDPGHNFIKFNIPGACPHVINVPTSLLVTETVTFWGSTQPGTVKNTAEGARWNGAPCIVLRGPGSGGTMIGIETGGDLGSGAIAVSDLAFERFPLAIGLLFGENHRIIGNQFGGRVGEGAGSFVLDGNAQAIALVGGKRTIIGGVGENQRNLISGASDVGVLITQFLGLGGEGVQVINNVIGLDKNGTSARPNGTGIRINGFDNEVEDNWIAGNTVDGVLISGSNARGNVVRNNFIGSNEGSLALVPGNGRMGVMVQNGAHSNAIGPDNAVFRNGDDGIRVFTDAGGRNQIFGNRILNNDALGIDIGANGVSANTDDPSICDPTSGCAANRGQNYPELSSAERRISGLIPIDRPIRIQGTLRSTIGGPYQIEVFTQENCEANDHGEGARLIGVVNLTIPNAPYCPPPGGFCIACTNGNCTKDFTVWVPELDVNEGDVIVTTATSPQGDTSEFSECRTLIREAGPDELFRNGFETNILP